jgi:hypothetical protein
MKHTKISIGRNKWIECIDLTVSSKPFYIDGVLLQTKALLKNLETVCIAECCGIDAFALWQQDIAKASEGLDKEAIKMELQRAKAQLLERPEKLVTSEHLNSLFEKKVFIRVLDHLLACL